MKKEPQKEDLIIVRGARTHNLKNITVEMPRNKMVVFTGLSGSGKSSLAFDTIFAEGQRRYVESLSSYARQFLRQMQKPDVDEIIGLSPAMSIDLKSRSNALRSPVATFTELYDYIRILYDLLGKRYAWVKVDGQIKKHREQIILTKNKKHNIDVLVDEFFLTELKDKKSGASERLSESVERALAESKGLIKIETHGIEKLISHSKTSFYYCFLLSV